MDQFNGGLSDDKNNKGLEYLSGTIKKKVQCTIGARYRNRHIESQRKIKKMIIRIHVLYRKFYTENKIYKFLKI